MYTENKPFGKIETAKKLLGNKLCDVVIVIAEYSPEFPTAAKSIGMKYDGYEKVWRALATQRDDVEKIFNQFYNDAMQLTISEYSSLCQGNNFL